MEIVPGVHSIPGTTMARIYLIEDDDELTLVDTGMPWSAKRVLRYIQSIGRQQHELRRILVTHNHPDHTGGAPGICRHSNAQLIAHPQDTKQHRHSERGLDYMGLFNTLSLPIPFLQHIPVQELINENDIIPVGGGIRVIHTPGHTPGSVCYLMEDRSLMFGGDTIFSNGTRVSRSMSFPGSNPVQYQQSLERLASMQFDILCGGHGAPLVGGASDMLRTLLKTKPNLPTWGEFIVKRLPTRLMRRQGLTTED